MKPPLVSPYQVEAGESAGRFLARVLFSIPRVTVPAMLLAIVWQVGESAVPVVMGLAIDRALATGDTSQLVLWIAVLVVLYVVLTTAARFTGRLNVQALQLLQHRLRATLSLRVLHPIDNTVGGAPDGAVVSTMTNDVGRLANGVLLTTMTVSRIAAIGFIAVSLLRAHWLLGVVVLVGAPLVVWLMGVLSRQLSRSTHAYQGLLAATIGRATDLVAGYRVIKGIRAEDETTRRYEQASQETLDGALRHAGLLGRFQVVSGIANAIFVAAVTGLAGWFTVDGQLSIGALIATVGLTQALLPQIEGLVNASLPNLANSHASAARILDTLNAHLTVPSAPRPDQPNRPTSAAPPTLELTAPYAAGPGPGVSGATVRVEPGELVGVRAGDRTAARITDALLQPHGAHDMAVRLSERPATELGADEYRSQVTVAPHRTTLFTGSIRDNLTTPTSTPDRLDAATRAAGCEDFAIDLDAPVGENGNRLSGGQRQRVALARALAAEAPLLVLHDPTTAVDSVTEQVIANRLRRFRTGRSTLLITSSPALLGCCDRVIDLRADEPAPTEATETAGKQAHKRVAP